MTSEDNVVKMERYAQAQPRARRANKIETIAQIIRAETGQWPSRTTLSKITGLSGRAADNALRTLKAVEMATGTTTAITYTKAQDHHIRAKIKILEAEFRDHVRRAAQKLYDENFPTLEREKLEAFQQKRDYERLFNAHEHIFTMAEYNDLLLCTHEANPSDETRKRAFMALNARKFQLTGKR